VHLLTYVPELRGKQMQVIEEPVVVRDVVVSLREDKTAPRRVYLAPEQRPLPFTRKNGYLTVLVPEVPGYQMLVFEW